MKNTEIIEKLTVGALLICAGVFIFLNTADNLALETAQIREEMSTIQKEVTRASEHIAILTEFVDVQRIVTDTNTDNISKLSCVQLLQTPGVSSAQISVCHEVLTR